LWRTQTIAQPGSPGDGAKRRIGVDDRQLRPVPQLAVLGHGRPHSAYRAGARHRRRGGLVHRFNAGSRRRHRQDRLAPPVSAPRQLEPRSCVRADSRGHQPGGGRPRQALLAIGKPGIIWALDRRTGEFLWARETTHQTVFKSIDPETGKVAINESLIPKQLEQNHVVCPSFYGGKLWMATAYDPASKTLFLPLNNLCMDYKAVEQKPLVGEDYGRSRMQFRHAPGNNGNRGGIDAVNLESKETLWTQPRRPYWSSSLLVTAGGIVFGGDTNRRVAAFDAGSGKVLWELPLNSQPGGFPMTYMAGGKQYVAIPAGLSLIGNRVVRSLTPEIPVPG